MRPLSPTIGALAMGSSTYEWIVKNQPGQWMYTQPSWVLTTRPGSCSDGHPVQTFDGDIADLHGELLAAAGDKDVWVVGAVRPRHSSWRPAWSTRWWSPMHRAHLGAGARLLPMPLRNGYWPTWTATVNSPARAGAKAA